MVMESRKAAPALRARPLRSYVPLRRDPSESVLSGTIPGLPGGLFSTTNSNSVIHYQFCGAADSCVISQFRRTNFTCLSAKNARSR